MKNNLIKILCGFCFLLSAFAGRAWTITNFTVGVETNWPAQVVPKLNNNYNNLVGWLNQHDTNLSTLNSNYTALKMAFTNYLGTNVSGGGGGTIYITNIFNAYQFSNSVLSSAQITTYQTNFAYWRGSNYLGRFNGLQNWVLFGGDDGGSPPGTIPMSLNGSYNGSNSWFLLTNGFQTSNTITVVALTNGASSLGGTLVNPGNARLYSIDHWELLNRTNNYFGQFNRYPTPVNSADAATKGYADALFENAFNQNFSSYSSNSTYHTVYFYQNSTYLDISGTTVLVPITNTWATNFITIDDIVRPTNFVFQVSLTNLAAGFEVQSSTNLALIAGFTRFTNVVTVTNGGTVTFTTPLSWSEDARFFRIVSSSSGSLIINVPVTINSTLTVTRPAMQCYFTNVTFVVPTTSLRIYFSPGYDTTNFTVSAPNSLAASYVSARGTNYFDVMFTAITLSGVTVEGVVLKR